MIRLGTSGFSFKDWKGVVYPKKLALKDALVYYEQELGFDCVEINSTYYTLVSERSFEGMERKTGPGFEFAVKAYKGITHDPFDPRLTEGTRPDAGKAREDTKRFISSLQPLRKKGKLGAVLLQFPVFFSPSARSQEYMLECKEAFADIPLVIEFRSRSWAHPEVFAFLEKHGLAYCAVDEPALSRLMPFRNEVTAPLAYVRLHGRNKKWFSVPAEERYNYLYSNKELESFVPEIKKMDEKAKKTFVFFNNCHGGQAAKNALTMRALLGLKNPHSLLA